jgi:arylsulfatase A-like enzyme
MLRFALAGGAVGGLAKLVLRYVQETSPHGYLDAGLPWIFLGSLLDGVPIGFAIGAACGVLATVLLSSKADGAARALQSRLVTAGGALALGLTILSLLLPMLRPRADAPNLLLISVDTLRADRLGCYGSTSARTPNIDALALQGTLWETVIAAAPVTLPATCTLMTGIDPPGHGVQYNGYYVLDASQLTLAEFLADRGYETSAVIGNFALEHRFGIDQGFGSFDDEMTRHMRGEEAKRRATGVTEEGETWWRNHLRTQDSQRSADEVTDAAIAVLKQGGQRPFFLWAHYMDPHGPYRPPAKFRGAADPYDGEVSFVDHEIGRLLRELDSQPDGRRTLVVLVADHGESLGEHDYTGHVQQLWEETLRVPFIARLPGVTTGERVTTPLAGRDVAGEILALLGLEPPSGRFGRALGKPFLSFAQTYYARFAEEGSPRYALRDERWKLLHEAGRDDRLFDLQTDPREALDVGAEHPDRMNEMLERLYARIGEALDSPVGLDDETADMMRELGYLGDEER